MKRIKLITLGLLVSVGVSLGVVSATQATWSNNLQSNESTVVVASDDTHDGSLYAASETVTVDGTVDGTLYCVAATVRISGTVNGDVLCAGQSLELTDSARVTGDVRLAGQSVDISGTIAGSATLFGQDVELMNGAEVSGDVNGGAQYVTVDGTVGGDMVFGMQALTLGGTVQGNVDVSLERITLEDEATVAGDLNYSASRDLDVDGARVDGAVSYNMLESSDYDGASWYAAIPVVLAMMLLSALVVALVMPRFVHRSSVVLRDNPLMTILLGFAVAFGTPIVAVLAMVSVLLLPVGLSLLLAWMLIGSLSGIFVAYYIGSVLLRGVENVLARMAGGAVVLLVLYLIPIVNIFALFVAWVVGSGLVVATLTSGYRRPDYSTAVEQPKKTAKRSTKKSTKK